MKHCLEPQATLSTQNKFGSYLCQKETNKKKKGKKLMEIDSIVNELNGNETNEEGSH